MRQGINGKAQSERRFGPLFVGDEVVHHKNAAGLERRVGFGKQFLIALGRLEATEVAGDDQVIVIRFNRRAVMLAVDETDFPLETALLVGLFCHRVDVGPVELRDMRRRIARDDGHAEYARTTGDVEDANRFALSADF